MHKRPLPAEEEELVCPFPVVSPADKMLVVLYAWNIHTNATFLQFAQNKSSCDVDHSAVFHLPAFFYVIHHSQRFHAPLIILLAYLFR